MSDRPKYVLVKFKPEDTRAYTYLAGDTALAIGDEVLVPMGRGDGEKRVIVDGFSDDEPAFACKAVIGLAPPREEATVPKLSEVDKLVASGAVETVGDILNPRAVIGDNGAPEPTPIEKQAADIAALYETAGAWLDGSKIENQEQADDVTKLIDDARKAAKAADTQRAAEKKPHDLAGKAVQAIWKPLIDKAEKVETAGKATLADWMRREADRQRQEAANARAIANDIAGRALTEARSAAASGSLDALDAAESWLTEAKQANKDAGRAEKERPVAKVDGMTRAMSLRTVWDIELAASVEGELSAGTLLARWAYGRDKQRCINFFMTMAREDVRTGVRAIPGTSITSREVL